MTVTVHDNAGNPDAAAHRRERVRGAAAMLPLTVGYVPFGLLLGAAAARSSDPLAAWVGTPVIYGGSAHLTVIELLQSGSGVLMAAGAAILVNVRLLVYSSALIPLWSSARLPAKLLAAAVIIDPTWMLAEQRAGGPGSISERRAHFVGAAITLTIGWILAISTGAVLGSLEGLAGPLAVAVPLSLTVVVAPHLRVSGGCWAIGSAVVVAVLCASWPPGTGMLAAMAAAAGAGAFAGRRS
jgi:predicted branched-subunit amino acid permease